MNRLKWGFILAGMVFISPAFTLAAADKDYFVGTYYYPWYHNNNFHGSSPLGSNTLIYHLNPRQTPQLGWYDQTDSDISQHYKWARYAGINFFAASYWGSSSAEDSVIRNHMFNNPDRGDIKLAVFLEPVITPANITVQTNYLCDNYFNRPGYFRIDDKPVIFIYVTRAMTDANLTTYINDLRAAATAKGVGAVYIVGDEVWGGSGGFKSSRVSLMDAITNYDVYGNIGAGHFATDSKLDTWRNNYSAWRTNAHTIGKDFIPGTSPGFNDRGVRPGHTPTSRKLYDESYAFGTLFSGMLDRVKPLADRDMIMITSWNEWHEDTQIEPVTPAAATNQDDGAGYYTDGLYYNGYGMLYLNILRDKTTMLALCDYDSDGQVGFYDIAFLLDYWLDTCTSDIGCIEADFTTNGKVNFADFAICAKEWTSQ
jgi:hypothetical protein